MSLYVDGELPVVATSGNCNNGGMFGNNGDWIWAFLLFALIGNNGWGGVGYGGGRGGVGENYVLATDFATIERKLDGVNNGLCDGFYAQNTNMLNGFASVQQTLCQGFNGVERSIANAGYNTQAGFNALSAQLAQCCCDNRAAISEVRFDLSKGLCDVIRAGQDNTRAILDYLTGEKIATLTAENSGLKAQISNDRQSAYIIDALAPKCPQPAYVVQPAQPVTFPTNCCGNVAYASFGGCGASVQ